MLDRLRGVVYRTSFYSKVCNKNKYNMKERIKESGLTITAVAKKLNINNSTFRSYLNGIRTMPDEVKKDINDLLKKYE